MLEAINLHYIYILIARYTIGMDQQGSHVVIDSITSYIRPINLTVASSEGDGPLTLSIG